MLMPLDGEYMNPDEVESSLWTMRCFNLEPNYQHHPRGDSHRKTKATPKAKLQLREKQDR
jgi:hypothetical protein